MSPCGSSPSFISSTSSHPWISIPIPYLSRLNPKNSAGSKSQRAKQKEQKINYPDLQTFHVYSFVSAVPLVSCRCYSPAHGIFGLQSPSVPPFTTFPWRSFPFLRYLGVYENKEASILYYALYYEFYRLCSAASSNFNEVSLSSTGQVSIHPRDHINQRPSF